MENKICILYFDAIKRFYLDCEYVENYYLIQKILTTVYFLFFYH